MSEHTHVAAPKRKMDWRRHRIVSTGEFETSQAKVPAGRTGRIERVGAGKIWIIFDACSCCGMSPVVRLQMRVDEPPYHFAFIAEARS